jgi:hypothetical protein
MNESIEKFINVLQEYKLWNTFETKACLIIEDESSEWKVSFLYTSNEVILQW